METCNLVWHVMQAVASIFDKDFQQLFYISDNSNLLSFACKQNIEPLWLSSLVHWHKTKAYNLFNQLEQMDYLLAKHSLCKTVLFIIFWVIII